MKEVPKDTYSRRRELHLFTHAHTHTLVLVLKKSNGIISNKTF